MGKKYFWHRLASASRALAWGKWFRSAGSVYFCRFQWLNLLVTVISICRILRFCWNIKIPRIIIPEKLGVISVGIRVFLEFPLESAT